MGLAASLFYDGADAEKQTLFRRITPTTEQFEDQQRRWNALADYLCADLNRRSGHPIRTWLQGSYKFGTQVRGARHGDEFDIDLGIYYEWSGDAGDGDYGPKALKGMVQASLSSYDGEDAREVVSPPKARCSRIRFEGDFHIDVPAYHLEPDRDERRLATQGDDWEPSDPKALYLWFRNSFDDPERRKVRRQIRYIKIWAGLKFPEEERPSSTLLTVLIAEAFQGIQNDLPDDETLAAALSAIVLRLEAGRRVASPVNENEDLAQRLSDVEFNAFLDGLRQFQVTAEEALREDDLFGAAEKWSEPFAHFFPLPEAEEVGLIKNAALPVLRFTPG